MILTLSATALVHYSLEQASHSAQISSSVDQGYRTMIEPKLSINKNIPIKHQK